MDKSQKVGRMKEVRHKQEMLITFVESIRSARTVKLIYRRKVRIEVTSSDGRCWLGRGLKEPSGMLEFYDLFWVRVICRYTNVKIIEVYTWGLHV